MKGERPIRLVADDTDNIVHVWRNRYDINGGGGGGVGWGGGGVLGLNPPTPHLSNTRITKSVTLMYVLDNT